MGGWPLPHFNELIHPIFIPLQVFLVVFVGTALRGDICQGRGQDIVYLTIYQLAL